MPLNPPTIITLIAVAPDTPKTGIPTIVAPDKPRAVPKLLVNTTPNVVPVLDGSILTVLVVESILTVLVVESILTVLVVESILTVGVPLIYTDPVTAGNAKICTDPVIPPTQVTPTVPSNVTPTAVAPSTPDTKRDSPLPMPRKVPSYFVRITGKVTPLCMLLRCVSTVPLTVAAAKVTPSLLSPVIPLIVTPAVRFKLREPTSRPVTDTVPPRMYIPPVTWID